jgi:formate dehydrogenase
MPPKPSREPASSAISAQARYAAGAPEILQSFFGGTPIREEYLIVDGGMLAGTGARSCKLT